MDTVGETEKVVFRSTGFMDSPPEANAIIKDEYGEVIPSFVTQGMVRHNWTNVDVPSISRMIK